MLRRAVIVCPRILAKWQSRGPEAQRSTLLLLFSALRARVEPFQFTPSAITRAVHAAPRRRRHNHSPSISLTHTFDGHCTLRWPDGRGRSDGAGWMDRWTDADGRRDRSSWQRFYGRSVRRSPGKKGNHFFRAHLLYLVENHLSCRNQCCNLKLNHESNSVGALWPAKKLSVLLTL